MDKTYTIKEYNDLKQRVINLRVSIEQASAEERIKLFPELMSLEEELKNAKIFEPNKEDNNIIPKNISRKI